MLKQVIVVREDILKGIPRGKIWAQVAHAGREIIRDYIDIIIDGNYHMIPDEFWDWIRGDRTTICLTCKDEDAMLEIAAQAEACDLPVWVFEDMAKTCFPQPTKTCVAIGPADSDMIDTVTRYGSIPTKLA